MPGGTSLAEVTTERPRPRPRAVATNTTPTGTGDITFNTGSTGDIWTIWVAQAQITTSATTTSNVVIWKNWVESSITSGTIRIANSSQIVSPSNAATAGTISFGTSDIWTGWIQSNNPSHEQVQAAVRRQAQYNQQNIEAEAERAKARERAEKLLHENLDDKQKAELAAKGYFELDVHSSNGQVRRYRIHRKWSGNIQQVDPTNGQRLKTLCIHPREQTPVEDSMLAQKLMLEGGMEDELLRIANHS